MAETTRDHAHSAAPSPHSAVVDPSVIARLRAIAGDANVHASPDEMHGHSLDIGPFTTRGVAVVFPGSANEVSRLVRVAADAGLAVWTVSKGKNWGYGAKMSNENGALILVLERMNRILEVNDELAYAVVEPGVTYGQLNAHLESLGHKLWADCTDSTPDASVLGNALERGVGTTAYADHFGALCGMEVVLASGALVRTGGGSADSRARHTYKWGTGPFVDGLFSQSNLGIVTSAGIWLMPAPEAMTLFGCNVDRDEDVPAAADALRRLSLAGVVQPNVHISNDVLVLANLVQYPYDRLRGETRMPPSLRAELRREHMIAPWTVIGAVYGDRARVANAEREIRRAFRGLGRVEMIGRRKLALARAALAPWRRGGRGSLADRIFRRVAHSSLERTEALQHLHATFRGVPGEFVVSFPYFKNRRYAHRSERPLVDVDPARDGCGMTWAVFACPITARDTRDFLACVRPIVERHGFDFSMSLLTINARTFYALLQFFFDRDDPDERARVRGLYDEVLDAAPRHGFQQVRASIASYDRLLEHAPDYAALVGALKRALDPENVLAPGRYGVGR